MSSPFNDEAGPQPPRQLKTAVEINANLRQLQQNHTPLILRFVERQQRFQTFLVAVDLERKRIALDELIPNDGERLLANQEAFHIEGFHEGVRIAWQCEQPVKISELDGARCYWLPFPEEITYHQRRGAYRVVLKLADQVSVSLSGKTLSIALQGKLQDISATGCRLSFPGDVSSRLQAGQVYENFSAKLPFGVLTLSLEARHVQFDEKHNCTFLGARFFRMSGLEQRNVERFVYQLQREARRFDLD